VTLADALSAHDRALDTGGMPGIPNLGLVQSAIERPYNGYYRSIAKKAAALVESMSTNHGFTDGNKRTTIILTHLLLSKSGYRIIPLPSDAEIDLIMEDLVLAVVQHEKKFNEVVEWFKQRLRRF
jgi:death-on-curing protein